MSTTIPPDRLTAKLASVPLFAELAPEALDALSGMVQYGRHPKGTVLAKSTDTTPCMFLLVSGRVKIALTSTDGKELALNYLDAPDYFGELSLVDQEPRLPNAVALTEVEILRLEARDLAAAIRLQPRLALSLIATLSHRLRSTVSRLEDMAFSDATQRVTRVLLNVATAGLETRGAPVIQGMTHYEIATLAGTSRETASRVISALGREGVLNSRGRRIVVDLEKLSAKLERQ
jgi:CRP/FNR family transcriptional regulator, cyclic AMP receptor protein